MKSQCWTAKCLKITGNVGLVATNCSSWQADQSGMVWFFFSTSVKIYYKNQKKWGKKITKTIKVYFQVYLWSVHLGHPSVKSEKQKKKTCEFIQIHVTLDIINVFQYFFYQCVEYKVLYISSMYTMELNWIAIEENSIWGHGRNYFITCFPYLVMFAWLVFLLWHEILHVSLYHLIEHLIIFLVIYSFGMFIIMILEQ